MSAQEKMDQTNNTHEFKAEVSRLLGIVTNALYSNKDIFLRELISNASDACDKLRYEAISNPELLNGQSDFAIDLSVDMEARTISITDNGVGMDHDDLIENLGTIARSGTAKLMEQLKSANEATEGAPNLIGQFGVGFYASFMVAEKVDVITRKAGSNETWMWSSDGVTGYQLANATTEQEDLLSGHRGTHITLYIKDDASDYLIPEKLEQIIRTYSDHVAFPITIESKASAEENTTEKRQVNSGAAIWARNKSELTDEDYTNFYQSLTYGMDEPLLTTHWTAEGKIEYTGLLYTPTLRPFDMFDPGRRHAVKLYVKRVFITDDCESLVYPWLRFLRGVIDCQDLQLNISREMLQHNPMIHMMRRGIARKVLGELLKLSRNDESAYNAFWGQFGMVLKEGLYDAVDHRDELFKLCRFPSTETDGLTGLEDYIERMKDGQDKIYYITGENADALRKSPQIEGYKARGIEVLIMTDTIDSFWLQNAPDFDGKLFQSVTKGEDDLSAFDTADKSDDTKDESAKSEDKAKDKGQLDDFITLLKSNLSEDIGDVRISKRLRESPVCLVAAEHGVDMHMENVLKIQQHYQPTAKRILEINATHEMITALADNIKQGTSPIAESDAAQFLLDQAKILQGEKLDDPSRFASQLTALMTKAMK